MTDSELFNLKIVAIFEIFVASFLGYASPFIGTYFQSKSTTESPASTNHDHSLHHHEHHHGNSSETFKLVKAFSGGIILGVAFIHLIPESTERLSEFSDYPSKLNYLSMIIFVYYLISCVY